MRVVSRPRPVAVSISQVLTFPITSSCGPGVLSEIPYSLPALHPPMIPHRLAILVCDRGCAPALPFCDLSDVLVEQVTARDGLSIRVFVIGVPGLDWPILPRKPPVSGKSARDTNYGARRDGAEPC